MADLYIANISTQDHVFMWTTPEGPKIFELPIRAGSQACVIRDESDFVINFVLNHHKKYGLISVDEAKNFANQSRPIATVYSDKPIPAEVFGLVQDANEDIIARNVQLEKELTAMSMIKNIKENPELNEGIKEIELEIEEQTPKENDRKGKTLVKQKFSSAQK